TSPCSPAISWVEILLYAKVSGDVDQLIPPIYCSTPQMWGNPRIHRNYAVPRHKQRFSKLHTIGSCFLVRHSGRVEPAHENIGDLAGWLPLRCARYRTSVMVSSGVHSMGLALGRPHIHIAKAPECFERGERAG